MLPSFPKGRLRSASAVCVPSLQAESFGIVLLEAMAAGTPVVASDLPGYRAVTDDGNAALLFAVDDPAALADGVLRVLCDRELATRLQTAGQAIATRFDMERLAERYLAIYDRARGRWQDTTASRAHR